MKTDVEVSLIHDGRRWIVRNGVFTASGSTLAELDENLKRAIVASGLFEKGRTVKVFMGFDYDTIPTWIRQYAYHYFNRIVTLTL